MVRLTLFLVLAVLTAQAQNRRAAAAANDHYSNSLLEISVSHPEPTPMETRAISVLGERWRGGVFKITLTNVSQNETAIISDWTSAQYEFEVWDVTGKPVPLTAAGEKQRAARHTLLTYRLSTQSVTLHPGEQSSSTIDIARLFEIKPNAMYTVRVRRSSGLPDHDQSGKKVEQELSRTWVITGVEVQ